MTELIGELVEMESEEESCVLFRGRNHGYMVGSGEPLGMRGEILGRYGWVGCVTAV